MADESKRDTSEYSASKAPDTRRHAEERAAEDPVDWRLIPGGRTGSPERIGMDALEQSRQPEDPEGPARHPESPDKRA